MLKNDPKCVKIFENMKNRPFLDLWHIATLESLRKLIMQLRYGQQT